VVLRPKENSFQRSGPPVGLVSGATLLAIVWLRALIESPTKRRYQRPMAAEVGPPAAQRVTNNLAHNVNVFDFAGPPGHTL